MLEAEGISKVFFTANITDNQPKVFSRVMNAYKFIQKKKANFTCLQYSANIISSDGFSVYSLNECSEKTTVPKIQFILDEQNYLKKLQAKKAAINASVVNPVCFKVQPTEAKGVNDDVTKIKNHLERYIAGGAPTEDTLLHYNTEIDNFLEWCYNNAYKPLEDIDEETAFDYLQYLNNQDYSQATINLKISAAKTFYFVANRLKLFGDNPFKDVKPKKPVYDDADFDYFNLEDLKEICDSLLKRTDFAATRDLAIVMLMAVEGLRTVEVHRMSDEDINWQRHSILIHGKGKDSYIYPCEDTFNTLEKYINDRKSFVEAVKDERGTPTFTGLSKKFFGTRISRNGLRFTINQVLAEVKKKKKGSSCHTLRHSCGTNLYAETKDLRLVQETLRHSDPNTSARYAHVVDRLEERKTNTISPLGKK